jgi:RNA polymerase sigma-70 factor (ECF subfamily)
VSTAPGGRSETELVEAAQAGDAAALEALLERHERRLFRFARRLCRHREDAEDVLQESLLAAARALPGFRGASSISTWLYTIARSYCIKKRRRSVFAPALVSLEGDAPAAVRRVADPARGPEEALESKRLEAALDRAIAALDRPYREVLLLRDVEGLSAAEVAGVTGLSVPAVKTRLHRARARLRERLAPLFAPPPKAALPLPGGRPCPDVIRLFSRHLEGDIEPRTCARMEKHLAACPRCEASCEQLKQVLRMCRTAPEPDLPAEVQDKVRGAIRRAIGGPSRTPAATSSGE